MYETLFFSKGLEMPNEKDNRKGLINPYNYYLSKIELE
jgi:hypothetical protein